MRLMYFVALFQMQLAISEVYMYADDTKLYREIKTIEDQRILQKDLDTLTKWSEIWLLKFHPEKCLNLTISLYHELAILE